MLSVVIRNKNQEKALTFLLKNLRERYADDIDEIIVLDNLSTDGSKKVSELYKTKFVTIEEFSYGESANIGARVSSNNIVVMFSAHSFPISHDFFKLIKAQFKGRENELAGLRCLHNFNDYSAYINNLPSTLDYNKAGLIFAGSVFNKKIWEKYPFKKDIKTFEDKEWSKRVIEAGYKIEFVPSIFCYNIKRSNKQLFFRFKNEVIGSYQLYHTDYTIIKSVKNLLHSGYKLSINYFVDLYYLIKKFLFMLKFLLNKPEQFK
ncbi:MAG: glycosyltransferase [Flavobacteriaceae bacterium]|nr:glycosyltransferase [Flavobacteriaceae bacterium]